MCEHRDKVLIHYPLGILSGGRIVDADGNTIRKGTNLVLADKCMAPLLKKLWSLGIKTEMHCCGHEQQHLCDRCDTRPSPWIVLNEDMKNLKMAERNGYKVNLWIHQRQLNKVKEYYVVEAQLLFLPRKHGRPWTTKSLNQPLMEESTT